MKNYSSVPAARRAIEQAGLSGMTVEYPIIRYGRHAGRVEPVVFVGLREDHDEVLARGFAAKFDAAKAAQ